METKRSTYATKSENGKIAIINGTACSGSYCHEYGCDFPNCATFSSEEFDTVEAAKQAYPELKIV